MKKLAAAVVVMLALAGCNAAVTAYNRDHTKSWMCVPNTKLQEPPLPNGQPLVIEEPAASAPRIAGSK